MVAERFRDSFGYGVRRSFLMAERGITYNSALIDTLCTVNTIPNLKALLLSPPPFSQTAGVTPVLDYARAVGLVGK